MAEAEEWAAYLQNAIEKDRFMCRQTCKITTEFKPAKSESNRLTNIGYTRLPSYSDIQAR
jgi:hypothetical protein